MSYSEQILGIVTKYRAANQPWPASAVDIARWAMQQKLWEMHPAAMLRQCADQIAQAMRDDFITDRQGRRIRAKHAAHYSKNGQQLVLWDDIRTAPRMHMELALAQRRSQIVMDCRQLKLDADSFNENYNDGRAIQIVFDFRRDMEEMELIAKRPPAA